ncbi:MAG: hypothetical protein Q8O40_10455 [Chloroflexota bacterium]|nr:hypothetical protein [Chloroflexota bacterium]
MGLALVMAIGILVVGVLLACVCGACLWLARVLRPMRERPAGAGGWRYLGGQRAGPGHYWRLSTGALVVVRKDGEVLPGGAGIRYLRTPRFIVLLMGPLAGGLYVLALPLVACGALMGALAVRAGQLLERWGVATALARALAGPRWMPGRSYLMDWAARRRPRKEAPAPGDETTPLDRLEAEIRERREKGQQ